MDNTTRTILIGQIVILHALNNLLVSDKGNEWIRECIADQITLTKKLIDEDEALRSVRGNIKAP